ncbi:MAG: HAMP domain-containing histidine kinase [Clostridia bacterium]|nr:HAMP domain-containing histidine kinase [Clostridia bacterium]
MKKDFLHNITDFLFSCLIFFGLVGGVVTATFYVFFATVSLPEEDIRAFAPVVFVNVVVISLICAIVDTIRRRVAVDRPARRIREVLDRLAAGDFKARIPQEFVQISPPPFGEIEQNINKLADELSGIETLRTDFIANVSHEMKTPLSVISNYGTLLQDPELDEQTRMEYAKQISRTSRRLALMMTNILKLNRLENQQIYPQKQTFDLGEQLCECLIQYEEVWERRNITIETDIEDEVLVTEDAELLSLVWNNLLSNAFKFTEDGGTVSLSMHKDEDRVTVTVTDTGCGMTPETGKHIFEKFYQGDTSRATKGNGLGLTLVKRVIDIVQGEIRVQSQIGVGSTFTVILFLR